MRNDEDLMGLHLRKLHRLYVEVEEVARFSNSNIRSAFDDAKDMFLGNQTVITLDKVINKTKESVKESVKESDKILNPFNEVMRSLEGIQQKVGELDNDGDLIKDKLNKLYVEVIKAAYFSNPNIRSAIRSAFDDAKHMFLENRTVVTLNKVINEMKESNIVMRSLEGIQQKVGELANDGDLIKLYVEVEDIALDHDDDVYRAFDDAKHMFLENKTLVTLNEVINKMKGHDKIINSLNEVIGSLEGIQQKVGELDNDGDLIKEKLNKLYDEVIKVVYSSNPNIKSAFGYAKLMFLKNRTLVTLNEVINKMKESVGKEIDTLFVNDGLDESMKRLEGIQQKLGELGIGSRQSKLTHGFCRSICDNYFQDSKVPTLFKSNKVVVENLTPIIQSYLGL